MTTTTTPAPTTTTPAPVRIKLSAGERIIRNARARLKAQEERAARMRLEKAAATIRRQLLKAQDEVRALDLELQLILGEMPPAPPPEANGWHKPDDGEANGHTDATAPAPGPKYGTVQVGDAEPVEMSKSQLDHVRDALKPHGKRKAGELEDGTLLLADLGAEGAERVTIRRPKAKPVVLSLKGGLVTFGVE